MIRNREAVRTFWKRHTTTTGGVALTKQGGAACTNPVLVSFCKKLNPEPRSGEDVLAAPNDDEGGVALTKQVGPGPSRATFYHVFGDLVSTHMSPNAARVIRIAKHNTDFGVLYPHSSSRFLAADGEWRYATADEED